MAIGHESDTRRNDSENNEVRDAMYARGMGAFEARTLQTASAAAPFGYAFAGVTLELARGRLLVDGADVGAGPLVLKLLGALCRSPGFLVTRQQLFEEIWPRQTVSDEALTKLIARLREMLGPHAKCLVTLRGRGLRLDAAVAELPMPAEAFAQAPAPTLAPAPAGASAPARPRGPRRVALTAAVTIALLAAIAVAAWHWLPSRAPSQFPSSQVVIGGYALTDADIDASTPETLQLMREAGTSLDNGELVRARALLKTAHETDRNTPVPGILIAIGDWHGQRDADPALEKEIAARINERTTPYVRLLARLAHDIYTRADEGEPDIAALTALRPAAWRLQLRRAHIALAQRREASALAALSQIPTVGPPADVVATALADRASLGDVNGASRALADGALADAPANRAIVLGRLEWTRHHFDAAIAHFDEASALADARDNFDDEIDAAAYAAEIAFFAGRDDAVARIERTIALTRRTSIRERLAVELAPLAAERYLDDGDRAKAAELLRAIAVRDVDRAGLEMLNARRGFVLPEGTFLSAEQRGSLRAQGNDGTVELVEAWLAHAHGDAETARQKLMQARARGIDTTYSREDAQLLDARLSGKPAQCFPDPPYPNLLRFATCRAVGKRL